MDSFSQSMNFEFSTADRIIFGKGERFQAVEIVRELGNNLLVVTGSNPHRADWLFRRLDSAGLHYHNASVTGEPDIDTISQITAQARLKKSNVLIAHGGGSVIDTAKAVAALATNSGNIFDYLEVIGNGNPLQERPLPLIALPTTAGTGSEVTRNAVVASRQHRVKVSLRHRWMIPDVAIVDPELTLTVPPQVTAGSGLDALTQLIEAYTTRLNNPLVDGICREGIRCAARSLKTAFRHGSDLEARTNMCLASLFGGLALANAKLGAVHGFAGPIGGLFDAPHGKICARLLPFVITANIRALESRQPDSVFLKRYAEVDRIITVETGTSGLNEWLGDLYQELPIRALKYYGITDTDIPLIIEKARKSSSMQGNPIELNQTEMSDILTRSL